MKKVQIKKSGKIGIVEKIFNNHPEFSDLSIVIRYEDNQETKRKVVKKEDYVVIE